MLPCWTGMGAAMSWRTTTRCFGADGELLHLLPYGDSTSDSVDSTRFWRLLTASRPLRVASFASPLFLSASEATILAVVASFSTLATSCWRRLTWRVKPKVMLRTDSLAPSYSCCGLL